MAIWLFIGGDIITMSALLFTYLYLRGVNTGGHWMSMMGYQGHSYAWYENALNSAAGLPSPTLIHVGTLSAGLNWTVTLLTVLSAAIVWAAEKGLRKSQNAKAFSSLSWVAVLVTIVAIALTIKQLQHIPSVFVAVNDSQTMSYTAYDSTMMVIIGSALIHLFLLAFLGVGLAIRSARGVINGTKWFQARLVRLFWVWVAVSAVIVSAVTTTINTIH
jgi:heme/copper-type cytochrome/quinol oxidase subunit 3